MSKIDIPLNVDESILAKTIAELTAKQQERIDRLSRMIYFIRDYVVKGITPTMIQENTTEDALLDEILRAVDKLRRDNNGNE